VVDKTLSIEELVKLAQSGAQITTERRPSIHATIKEADAKPTEISRFDDLIEKLGKIGQYDELVKKLDAMAKANESLAEAHKAIAAADIVKHKTQLEVLATLQSLVKAGNVTKPQPVIVDMTPLKAVLQGIQENSKPTVPERPVYEFAVERSRQGFIDKIVATPTIRGKY